MEQNTPKFRLRLNLFDAIVLLAALAVGAFLLWQALKPQVPEEVIPQNTATVRYTIRLQRWAEGTSELIQVGDTLMDNVKNYTLGEVVAFEAVPSTAGVLDEEALIYRQAVVEGYEDVLVTLRAPCTVSDQEIRVDSEYLIRVGTTVYSRGEGYMGSGPIVAVELEVEK